MSELAVIGLGNVGLAFSVALANRGFRVTGVDVDGERVNLINGGHNPTGDRSIDSYLRKVVRRGLLRCTTEFGNAGSAILVFVAVGTPAERSELGLNLGPALEACRSIGSEVLGKVSRYRVVAFRSTLPFGASDILKSKLEESSGRVCGRDFGFSYNPEMLSLGNVLDDIYSPDFVVVGSYDSRSGDYLSRFYRKFLRRSSLRVVRVNPASAEFIKLACNAFLTTKIVFANTVADMCGGLTGIDGVEVLAAVGLDKRIGGSFLKPGMPYGGQCFPKDLGSFVLLGKKRGLDVRLFETVRDLNDRHSYVPVGLAKKLLGDLSGKVVSVLGLAYKAGISDTRDSPSLKLIEHLSSEGARVRAFDPNVSKLSIGSVELCSDVRGCLAGSDCCFVTTREGGFRQVTRHLAVMNRAVIVDMVRLLDPKLISRKAQYAAVGLGPPRTV